MVGNRASASSAVQSHCRRGKNMPQVTQARPRGKDTSMYAKNPPDNRRVCEDKVELFGNQLGPIERLRTARNCVFEVDHPGGTRTERCNVRPWAGHRRCNLNVIRLERRQSGKGELIPNG